MLKRNVASEIAAKIGKAIALQADATKELDVDRMVRESMEAYGSILYILVNNVGRGFARLQLLKRLSKTGIKQLK